jgi:SulP family sulfate permease
MHVPINIPSLSMSTGYTVDMNKELKAHGISNMLSGCCGGLQNYVCYCNSVTYYKCNGGGVISGLFLALSSAVFFFIGPSLVFYVPR